MIVRIFMLAAASLVAASTAFAAVDDKCAQETAQQSLNQCYGELADAADKTLNQLYQKLIAKAEGDEPAALRAAQRAWITYRDKECNYETIGEQGGSIRPMEISMCVREMTEARVKDFENFLKGGTDK